MATVNAVLRGGPGDGLLVAAQARDRAGAAYTFVSTEDPAVGCTYRYSDDAIEHPTYGRLAVLVRTGQDMWSTEQRS